MRHITLFAATVLVATTALAHDGVKNPTVKARMDGMERIAASSKALGLMARGGGDFSEAELKRHTDILIEEAQRIPALFEPQEDDPKSEARPEIWSNWPDFTAKAQSMEKVALALSKSTSADRMLMTMRDLGQACSACHKPYRAER